jgi:HicB family
MDLDNHIEDVRRQLAIAAEAGGPEARALAERLTAPLDSAVRLTLLDVLALAAAEITRELAPGSVEVRLRGREPDFVVIPPPSDPVDEPVDPPAATPSASPETGETGQSRINLRLPEQLKSRVERAATGEGLSINAWLVRAVAAAVDRGEAGGDRERRSPRGAQRYTGWAR